jgi:hypothetical protein
VIICLILRILGQFVVDKRMWGGYNYVICVRLQSFRFSKQMPQGCS